MVGWIALPLSFLAIPGLARAQEASTDISGFEMLIVVWMTVVALGIWLGMRDRLVVFRNLADHGWVLAAAGMLGAAIVLSNSRWPAMFCLLAAAAALVVLAVRTAVDNPTPWGWVIALVTKLTLSVLLFAAVKDALHPAGNIADERARNREKGILWLIALVPLVWRLTRDRPEYPARLRRAAGKLRV